MKKKRQWLTFDKPPENNAIEKSALWLINRNFKDADAVFVYSSIGIIGKLILKLKNNHDEIS